MMNNGSRCGGVLRRLTAVGGMLLALWSVQPASPLPLPPPASSQSHSSSCSSSRRAAAAAGCFEGGERSFVGANAATAAAVQPDSARLAADSIAAACIPNKRRPVGNSPDRFSPGQGDQAVDSASQRRMERLYDSIRTKSDRHAVSRVLYKTIFRRSRDTTAEGRVVDENRAFAPYAGKRIGEIRIEREAPFGTDTWLERAANKLHTVTRPQIIRRDLLFRSGDRLDPQIVVRNLQLLQSRSYLSDAVIEVRPDSLDTTRVDLVVRTRDSWTIDIDADLHAGGETSLGLAEANLFGRGHLLRLETNFDYRGFDYGGNIVEYGVPNLFGSFFDFEFGAGRSFNTSRFDVELRKNFLRPTDYELGIAYHNDKVEHDFRVRDTTELVKASDFDLWGGYARYLPAWRVSTYLTGRYNHRRLTLRPADVGPTHHPALHGYDALLFGTGLYRERVYSASMIYGYGSREYLSAGFKSEVVGGYLWGEFADELYLGLSHTMGGFTSIGYLMGKCMLGGYVEARSGDWRRGALDLQVRWFSNLFRSGRTRWRQFAALSYTLGRGRFTGADESLGFTGDRELHASTTRATGTNRLLLNTETVFFTPYAPWGFRIALFGFCDAGLLGYHDNIFRNAGFASFGIGIRIRNEQLVFKTIQIRLGVAVGRRGLAESRYFRFSSESELEQYSFTPEPPERLLFE